MIVVGRQGKTCCASATACRETPATVSGRDFFFSSRRRHTRLQGDWSSDVCSSDLARRMGKSLGNYVGVGEAAQVQFDKTMSIPDALMPQWFELLTDRPGEEVTQLKIGRASCRERV